MQLNSQRTPKTGIYWQVYICIFIWDFLVQRNIDIRERNIKPIGTVQRRVAGSIPG